MGRRAHRPREQVRPLRPHPHGGRTGRGLSPGFLVAWGRGTDGSNWSLRPQEDSYPSDLLLQQIIGGLGRVAGQGHHRVLGYQATAGFFSGQRRATFQGSVVCPAPWGLEAGSSHGSW
jgi:hypothetical protein